MLRASGHPSLPVALSLPVAPVPPRGTLATSALGLAAPPGAQHHLQPALSFPQGCKEVAAPFYRRNSILGGPICRGKGVPDSQEGAPHGTAALHPPELYTLVMESRKHSVPNHFSASSREGVLTKPLPCPPTEPFWLLKYPRQPETPWTHCISPGGDEMGAVRVSEVLPAIGAMPSWSKSRDERQSRRQGREETLVGADGCSPVSAPPRVALTSRLPCK